MNPSRIRKLSEQISDPHLIEEAADLLYFTGMTLSKGRLWVTSTEAILFVDGRYYHRAKAEAPCSVSLWDEQKKMLSKQKRIVFDSANTSYETYLGLKNEFPHVEWIPHANPAKELRLCKEPQEIAALKKAAQLTWRGYQKVVEMVKEGVSEEELALEFEIFCRKNGASALSFQPIIAFGEHSAYPHYRAGTARLQPNQIVLVDVGAVVDHYHADMTRLYFFGKVDPQLLRFEQIVKKAQRRAIEHVKPGVRLGELDRIVLEEFDKENVKPLYIHSLGHGIGLETHEYPRIKYDGEDRDLILKPGMVFTIEPGLYQPGLGGVRIEDMILVTETGYENFFAHG